MPSWFLSKEFIYPLFEYNYDAPLNLKEVDY